ncbi:MAG: hypothetical protein Q8L48_11525 [Archangium sp.]|nr:hypothetical protein [Archangium sp.]
MPLHVGGLDERRSSDAAHLPQALPVLWECSVGLNYTARCRVTPETKFVTREEFEPVKVGLEKLTARVDKLTVRLDMLTTRVEELTIRVEVLSTDVHRLIHQVADIAEDLDKLRDEVNTRFDEVNARFETLTGQMNARFTGLEQTQLAILSAVMKLSPQPAAQ